MKLIAEKRRHLELKEKVRKRLRFSFFVDAAWHAGARPISYRAGKPRIRASFRKYLLCW